MQANVPLVKDLVLVGGGHSHALVLRMWGMRPVPGVRVTLIHPGPVAAYSGMLPGFVAGHYALRDLQMDMVRLARFAGARIVIGTAEGIDTARREVRVAGRGPVGYDLLSVDIGVTSEMPALPGFAAHALPAKPLERFAEAWARVVETARNGIRVAVLGGGVAGAELAMAAAWRLRHLSPEVSLVERGQVLSALKPGARSRMLTALDAAGVTVHEGRDVAEVASDGLALAGGGTIGADCVIGAAGARPHNWIADTGLETLDGYLVVDAQLRTSDPAVFAAGDCAHLSHDPRPKAGVYAVRAAPVLAHNLRAALTGGQARPFRPQKDYLKLVSLGRKAALGEKAGIVVSGPWVWRWKDRIDRRFMARFDDLPTMPPPPVPEGAAEGVAERMAGPAPCGGCGAKVGGAVLRDALAALPRTGRADVLTRAGDDAAVLAIGGARQVVTTDHLRAFCEDPAVFARVAALHAMGDAWAMGAAPQAVLAQVTLPRMAERLQARTMAEILSAAGEAVTEAGAEIVGGHSAEGAELMIGFTVTGLLDGPALTLDGARPGDALVLTRGIGTGVVLAGEMAGRARGADVSAVWTEMQRSQQRAAEILRTRAHAMTDVTGFGLLGHLFGMAEASGVSAEVVVEDVPLLPGALALSEAGVGSTLLPANRIALLGAVSGEDGPREALLYDPQTAGGFLAAVPADAADGIVAALREAGFESAARIGRLVPGAPRITLE
ncbi:selenide, water dikinase SelD [Rhodobacterales bacterium HKCCE2091]|nr:selenide, water dikinase SelD [Rhodobacterales bacterium HKCCE2091]